MVNQVSMTKYNATDQHLHLLCQPIAKAGRSFVSSEKDDSHTNLYFDQLTSSLKGRWINKGDRQYLLSLDLKQNCYKILNESMSAIHQIPTIGKSISALEIELSKFFSSIDLSAEDYLAKLHFEIPQYTFDQDSVAKFNEESLEQWMYYRRLANQVLESILGYFQYPGEVRIWPHHFDTGIYIQLSEIGIGVELAMKDEIGNSPYFYVAGYPSKNKINFEESPQLLQGFWSTNSSWKGAVYPLKNLMQHDEKDQKENVEEFILTAITWYLSKPI